MFNNIKSYILIAFLVLILIFFSINKNQANQQSDNLSSYISPSNINKFGGILFIKSTKVKQELANEIKSESSIVLGSSYKDKTKLTIYIDFMCPGCRIFEKNYEDKLKYLVDSNKIYVEYRPLSILDRFSSTEYSTRALNAVGCFANEDPDKSWIFISELLEKQPNEYSQGLDNNELIKIANTLTNKNISQCIQEGKYKDWAKAISRNAINSGIEGTPTIYINDKKITDIDKLFDYIN